MLFKFVALWLGIAFLVYIFLLVLIGVQFPLSIFFQTMGAGFVLGIINFLTSTYIHKSFLDRLTDQIREKTPTLPTSEAENIYDHFEQTINKLLEHNMESCNQLLSSAEKLKLLNKEIKTDKEDQEEQLGAISELYEEIVSLYDIGRKLGSIIDRDQLIKTILEMSVDSIGASKGVLMLLNEKDNFLEVRDSIGYPHSSLPLHLPLEAGLAGRVIGQKHSLIISDLANSQLYKDFTRFGFETNSCLLTPLLLQDKAIGLIYLGDKTSGEMFTAGNEKHLTALANQAAIFIENVRLFEESLTQQRMQEQLKIAHEIQLSLLPSTSPRFNGFDIYGTSIPAVEVGGDYFDYFELDDNTLGLVVGDVSGKGVPAAMLMTMTRSMLKSQAEQKTSPGELLGKVNNLLAKEDIPDRFVTMIYAQLESISKELTLACAGHDALIVYHAEEDEFKEYHPQGMVLGILPDQKLDELKVQLKKDDIALMYTDGITEAMNSEREQFGIKNFENVVKGFRHLPAKELTEEIIEQVKTFSHDCPQHDDITLLVIKSL